jgi:hypothetical protein
VYFFVVKIKKPWIFFYFVFRWTSTHVKGILILFKCLENVWKFWTVTSDTFRFFLRSIYFLNGIFTVVFWEVGTNCLQEFWNKNFEVPGASIWVFTAHKCIGIYDTRLEKRLLIIRNLQSEKTIVDKQEEFYLSKESFLLKRKDFLISRNFLPLQKETFFWQVKLFLFIENRLLTLHIPYYQEAFF